MSILALILAISSALFVSWMIGANSVASTFGPVAKSNVSGVLRGALLAGIFGLLGAVIQGDAVAGTIGTSLLQNQEITAVTGSVVLLIASSLVIIGVFSHIPTPIAFTVVGGVIGIGLGSGAVLNIAEVRIIILTWTVIPFVAVALGYLLAKFLRSRVASGQTENRLGFGVFVIGSFCAFTAGANLGGLAVGPLLSVIDLPIRLLLLLGGSLILLGTWLGGPRIVNAVSKEYSEMGTVRSICALITATSIAQIATIFGIPVSFNEVIIASMVGSGLAAGTGSVQLKKITKTIISWISVFSISILLSMFVIRFLI